MKTENVTQVAEINLLSYSKNNPLKNVENVKHNLYPKDEVKQIVCDIIDKVGDGSIPIEYFNYFTYDLMFDSDEFDEDLGNALSIRIYEALNDLYNPFPEYPSSRRIGLDMYEDSFDILCDLDTPFTQYIMTHYSEAYGGVFEIDSEDYNEVEDEIIHSVESVIYDIYIECLKALKIEK